MTEEMIDSLVDVESANITERERIAVRFAELMATDHNNIGDDFFEKLRSEFTDPEIFELGMVTGQFIGYGRLLSILDLENPDQPEGDEESSVNPQ